MFNFEENSIRGKILKLLYKNRQLTKQNIAKKIKASIPTVISNVNELLEAGLVEEAGVANSTGGRKPVIVRFLPNSRYMFGVDINSENVKVILTNLDLEIKYSYEFSIDQEKNMDSVIDRVSAIVKEAIKVNQINEQAVIGIGFSLQGTVNEEKLILEWAPNIGIRDINFNKYKEMLKYPIYIENEANAAALAELNLGIEKEQENLVYISISSGIGAGVVLEDTLYKGKNKRAGEIGHMTLIPNGRKCKCGRRGCFEMYASQKALIKDFNGINYKNIESFQQFFELLNAGDARAKEYFDNYLNILAVGLQNIILVFDPDYIVLGGEISEFSQFYLDVLRGKVFEENKFYSKSDLKILPSNLQGDSSILGAALLPLERGIIFMDKNQ
jgi:predicted NBD/HSP70 family sugar kinase